jgi:2'-5' RNA ligase
MARLRTFIAIDLGKAIRDRLVALQETLGKAAPEVKWVEAENLHITLLFLGEVDQRDIAEVCSAVDGAVGGRAPFSLSMAGTGCFPNARRPRILWAGVGAGAQEVLAIHDAIETPLLELGCYRREERRYTPHVTLGRIRGERPPDGLDKALARQKDWQGGETIVHEVRVMASELTPQGPKYTVLSRAKLAE